MMQTDVLTARLATSGQSYVGRTRIKGMVATGTATAGTINIWDAITAPTSATYARSGTTVTVTSVAHGLRTGQEVGIVFVAGTGGVATNGNYVITVLTVDTFTVTDLNSGSVTAGAACSYSVADASKDSPWVASFDTAAVTAGANVLELSFPGEGIVCHVGIYLQITNMTGVTIFYG